MKNQLLLGAVMSTEAGQSRALERPATQLVAITSQSEKSTGQGTIQDGVHDVHEECLTYFSRRGTQGVSLSTEKKNAFIL